MWTALFWKDVAERAFFTALQVILALITVDGFDLANVDLKAFVVAVVTAVLGVIVKAGVANQVNGTVSPASFAKDETGL